MFSRIACDGLGNSLVVWESDGTDGSGSGVYARRFDQNGNALDGDFRVNTTTSRDQGLPAVGMDASGNFVVVWVSDRQDGDGAGVYGRRYAANGTALGGEFRVSKRTAGEQSWPTVGCAQDGRFAVAWQSSGQDGSGYGIYARMYSANGSLAVDEFRANSLTAGNQWYPSIAVGTDGSFTLAWADDTADGSGEGVYARLFTSNGTTSAPEFQVHLTTTGNQTLPCVALDPQGGFVVAWQDESIDYSGTGIAARRFAAAGAPSGNPFRVNQQPSYSQTLPSAAFTPEGMLFIAFASVESTGYYEDVWVKGYNLDGSVAVADTRLHAASGSQSLPSIAVSGDRRILATWSSTQVPSDPLAWDIEAVRYDPVIPLNPSVTVPASGPVLVNWSAPAAFAGNFTVVRQGPEQRWFSNLPASTRSVQDDSTVSDTRYSYSVTAYREFVQTQTSAQVATPFPGALGSNATRLETRGSLLSYWSIAARLGGGFALVTSQEGGGGSELMVRRFGPSGTPIEPSTPVGIWTTRTAPPPIASLVGDGVAVVGEGATAAELRVFKGTLTLLGTLPLPNGSRTSGGALASLNGTQAAVAWVQGNSTSVRLRTFNATGQWISAEQVLASAESNASAPKLAALGHGGYAVVWSAGGPGGNRTRLVLCNASAQPVSGVIEVGGGGATGFAPLASVVGLSGNRCAVAWIEGMDVRYRVFDAAGAEIGSGGAITATGFTVAAFSLSPDLGGGFLITRYGRASRYSADGTLLARAMIPLGTSNPATVLTGQDFISFYQASDSDYRQTIFGFRRAALPPLRSLRVGGTGANLGFVEWDMDPGGQTDFLVAPDFRGDGDPAPFSAGGPANRVEFGYGSDRRFRTYTVTPMRDALPGFASEASDFLIPPVAHSLGPVFSPMAIEAPEFLDSASLAALPDGRFLLSWKFNGLYYGSELGVQQFDGAGTPAGPALRMTEDGASILSNGRLAVAPDGRALAVWVTPRSSGAGLRTRAFSSTAMAVSGPSALVAEGMGYSTATPDAAVLATGEAAVVWPTSTDPPAPQLYVRRVSMDSGQPLGEPVPVPETPVRGQRSPRCAADAAGRLAIVWQDPTHDGSGQGVCLRVFDAALNPLGPTRAVPTTVTGNQALPVVLAIPGGGWRVLWVAAPADGLPAGISMRTFSAQGDPVGPEIPIQAFYDGSTFSLEAVRLAGGDLLVLWNEWAPSSMARTKLQRFTPDGVPVSSPLLLREVFYERVGMPVAAPAGAASVAISMGSLLPEGMLLPLPAAWNPIESWRNQFFGHPGNQSDGADAGDFDRDGLANAFEFASRTSPLDPASVMRVQQEWIDLDGDRYLTVRIRVRTDLSPLQLIARFSDSPSREGAVAGTELPDHAVEHGDGTITRVFRDPVSMTLSPRRFGWLELEATGP